MSIVRYTNKKTGRVALYESTSHYDPVTKQSRPIRKYLGTEDPKTGELIPSTGSPGRKAGKSMYDNKKKEAEMEYKQLVESLKKDCAEKDSRIKKLEKDNIILRTSLERIAALSEKVLKG